MPLDHGHRPLEASERLLIDPTARRRVQHRLEVCLQLRDQPRRPGELRDVHQLMGEDPASQHRRLRTQPPGTRLQVRLDDVQPPHPIGTEEPGVDLAEHPA
jgi:hypothetical protein